MACNKKGCSSKKRCNCAGAKKMTKGKAPKKAAKAPRKRGY